MDPFEARSALPLDLRPALPMYLFYPRLVNLSYHSFTRCTQYLDVLQSLRPESREGTPLGARLALSLFSFLISRSSGPTKEPREARRLPRRLLKAPLSDRGAR